MCRYPGEELEDAGMIPAVLICYNLDAGSSRSSRTPGFVPAPALITRLGACGPSSFIYRPLGRRLCGSTYFISPPFPGLFLYRRPGGGLAWTITNLHHFLLVDLHYPPRFRLSSLYHLRLYKPIPRRGQWAFCSFPQK